MLAAPHRKFALGDLAEVQRARNATYQDEMSSGGTVLQDVTASGSTNTKGNYAALIDPTAFDCEWLMVYVLKNNTAVVADYLMDLAIGPALSESVFWPNLLFSTGNTTEQVHQALIPFSIPAGSRIAARIQSSDASAVVRAGCRPIKGGCFPGSLRRITAYGADTSDSGGVQVDPGASIDTDGDWSELTSALTNPVKWGVVAVGSRNNGNFGAALSSVRIDIGVGAAGSEAVLVSDLPLKVAGSDDCYEPCWHSLPVHIPVGQRVAARARSNNNDATDRLIDVAFYGID